MEFSAVERAGVDELWTKPLKMLRRFHPAGESAVAGMALQLAKIADLGLGDAETVRDVLEAIRMHRQQAPAHEILRVPHHVMHIFS